MPQSARQDLGGRPSFLEGLITALRRGLLFVENMVPAWRALGGWVTGKLLLKERPAKSIVGVYFQWKVLLQPAEGL